MALYAIRLVLLLLAAFYSASVHATFYNRGQFYDKAAKYGFAITSALYANGTQVAMRVTAPSSNGWIAVGSGHLMDSSVMFILYSNEAGDGLTLSIRTTKGHNEPSVVDLGTIDASLHDSSIKDGVMTADIRWRGDTKGVLYDACDVSNEKQAFIWAVNPNQVISSDDVDVAMQQHGEDYGVFFVNMPQTQNMNIEEPLVEDESNLHTRVQPASYYTLILIHAILLGVAFVVVFPAAVIGLRLNLPNSFKIHWMTQITASVLVLAGFVVAITTSILGVRYSSLTQPHQIIGICMCAMVALQVYFGREHHIHYVLWKKRTWYTWVHMGLGRLLMYGAMVNAILGLLLMGVRRFAIILGAYEIVVIAFIEFFAIRYNFKRSRGQVHDIEPMALKNYHKLKDVTVTETAIDEHQNHENHQKHGYYQ